MSFEVQWRTVTRRRGSSRQEGKSCHGVHGGCMVRPQEQGGMQQKNLAGVRCVKVKGEQERLRSAS